MFEVYAALKIWPLMENSFQRNKGDPFQPSLAETMDVIGTARNLGRYTAAASKIKKVHVAT